MPGRDGTGPQGAGSMTGRGMGPCGGGVAYGRNSGRGFGMGYGRGMGMGCRRGFFPAGGGRYGASAADEREWLQDRAAFLEAELTRVRERIQENQDQRD